MRVRYIRSGVAAVSVISIVACSSDNQSAVQAAGTSSVAGASAAGGMPNGGAGASAGGASPQAGAPAGGAQSGGDSQGGATSGGSAVGGGGGSGGSVANGGAGGSSGGAPGGAAGAAGGSARPEAELDGAGWTMKCNKPDTSADAQNRCYLLPVGATDCPSAGYTSVDQTLHFGGTPGTHYQVTIHFKGTHESGDYTGGTANPKEFLRGATHISTGVHTWLSMEVSSPAATYNPNSGGGAGSVQVYDYTATIPIDGGATIRLKAYDKDCLMHRYCQNDDYKNCKGLVQPPFSPADAPIDGSFLQMAVTAVVVK